MEGGEVVFEPEGGGEGDAVDGGEDEGVGGVCAYAVVGGVGGRGM